MHKGAHFGELERAAEFTVMAEPIASVESTDAKYQEIEERVKREAEEEQSKLRE
jgi:hypothetical protein